LESFAFDPRGEGPYTGVSDGLESSNDSVLRVVWICLNVDQFRAIVYDSDRTGSLLLATELFIVCRHVERDNDDLGEALEVLVGVEVESNDILNIE